MFHAILPCSWGFSVYNCCTIEHFPVVYHKILATSQIEMVRGGPGSYRLKLNESDIEAEIHTLRDGGLLMQVRVFY